MRTNPFVEHGKEYAGQASFGAITKGFMLDVVPSYANKFFYSLGFLSMTSLLMLIGSGMLMVLRGPNWWLTERTGVYVRSVHLWAAQAFIFFILLHLLIVFLTSGYRPPRRLTWVIGGCMLLAAIAEAEFGYGLRGDFSSQWRALQASDFYNGSGLGTLVNNLNYAQIYGIHIVFVPLLLLGLLLIHYVLVKVRGIARPWRPSVAYTMVHANHRILFLRGIVLIGAILLLASMFPSPLIEPVTIQSIAEDDPKLIATTLLSEWNYTSDTATYMDTIDPYTYDTASTYIIEPMQSYTRASSVYAPINNFLKQSKQTQSALLRQAKDYFDGNALLNASSTNPVVATVSMLTSMAQSGLYEASLRSGHPYDPTYVTRFLSDSGVMDERAQQLGITTAQYGMLREERGILPPGAWWLAPLGVLDHTILANDQNQDRDGALILGSSILLLIAFPYIPVVSRIPEFLGIDRWIWKTRQ